MQKVFEVLNVKCGGCANTLTKTLEKNGYKVEKVDLEVMPRKVTLEIDESFDEEKFKLVLRSIGYPLADDELSSLEDFGAKAKSFVSCAIGKIS